MPLLQCTVLYDVFCKKDGLTGKLVSNMIRLIAHVQINLLILLVAEEYKPF